MLRAMKIIERKEEKSAIYKITPLGEHFKKQNANSFGFDLLKIINYLDSIKVLIKFVSDNLEVSAQDISDILGNEMIFYNQILLGKGFKKPFNVPISQTLLDLLVEFRILQLNPQTRKYFY